MTVEVQAGLSVTVEVQAGLFLRGSRRRRTMAFGSEKNQRVLEGVVVLRSHVQERELVAHHVEVNPLPATWT